MVKKNLYLIVFVAISMLWCACKKPLSLSSSIEQQNISFARQLNESFPFADTQTYWHIRNTGQPVIRLCAAGGEIHWTLCYQTQQGGSRWWTQYKFKQIDNGAKIYNLGDFTEMDWWNLYLKIWWT